MTALAILGLDTSTSRASRERSTTIDFPTPRATNRAAGSPAASRTAPVVMSSPAPGAAAIRVSSAAAGRIASPPVATASTAAREAGMSILVIVSSAATWAWPTW